MVEVLAAALVGAADRAKLAQVVDSMSSRGSSSCQHPRSLGTVRPEEEAGLVAPPASVQPQAMEMGVGSSLVPGL